MNDFVRPLVEMVGGQEEKYSRPALSEAAALNGGKELRG